MSAKHGETSRNSSSEEWTIIDKTENLDEGENSEKLIPEARHLDVQFVHFSFINRTKLIA